MTKRIAILGAGIAGTTAAWQIARLAKDGAAVEATLFERSGRLGGIVETVHQEGFTIECGPDAWVTEKPWARELAVELGLDDDLLLSNDSTRKTHILLDGRLETMPDGMRMMVPTNLDVVDRSHLFSVRAKQSFHDELARARELLRTAPSEDESIASFTRRHFGEEVLTRIAAPLLSGVLGGDVDTLSVQAVMPQFVTMERTHGSLIAALRARTDRAAPAIFTTLRSGLETLVDRLRADIPGSWIRLNATVSAIARSGDRWNVLHNGRSVPEIFDKVFVAVPPRVAQAFIRPLDAAAADLLELGSSSAIVVALGYRDASHLALPPGFGFLVPPGSTHKLLACTFVDQKFEDRVPVHGRLLRAFFGGGSADELLARSDEDLAELAERELVTVLGTLPLPDITIVRRWPNSLPLYAVGHLDRMSELDRRVAALPGLTLLGNAYRGVGLPDLVRDARAAARRAAE